MCCSCESSMNILDFRIRVFKPLTILETVRNQKDGFNKINVKLCTYINKSNCKKKKRKKSPKGDE